MLPVDDLGTVAKTNYGRLEALAEGNSTMRVTKRARATMAWAARGGGQSSSRGEGTQKSTTEVMTTAKTVMATSARVTATGTRMATALTAMTVARMMPNGNKENKDKVTTTTTTATEGGGHCESCRDYCSGGCCHLWDATIMLVDAPQ
jgi:hypothetical protein